MSFFESSKKQMVSFDKPVYMELTPGTHVIRILEEKAEGFFQHWLGVPILCLGEECPQCKQNKIILAEYNNDFKQASKAPGFYWKSERGAVNVLDRTPVKICPECGKEVKAIDDIFPTSCPECKTLLVNVKPIPSNKVKILSRAGSVFEKIALFSKTSLDEEGNPFPITSFDIELLVAGNTTIPRKTTNMDKVEIPQEEPHDLSRAYIKLSAEEMSQKMRGVSLKDIFAARRATEEPEVEKHVEATPEEVADMRKKIASLLD